MLVGSVEEDNGDIVAPAFNCCCLSLLLMIIFLLTEKKKGKELITFILILHEIQREIKMTFLMIFESPAADLDRVKLVHTETGRFIGRPIPNRYGSRRKQSNRSPSCRGETRRQWGRRGRTSTRILPLLTTETSISPLLFGTSKAWLIFLFRLCSLYSAKFWAYHFETLRCLELYHTLRVNWAAIASLLLFSDSILCLFIANWIVSTAYNIATGNASLNDGESPKDEPSSRRKRVAETTQTPKQSRRVDENEGLMSHEDYIAKRR